MYDVIIVGGGPAGLSAALLLGRSRRSVLVCDSGQPRNSASHAMHGFLTRDGMAPSEFLRIAREELLHYPDVEYRSIAVTDATSDFSSFTITLADTTQVQSRVLLLATGMVDELPAVPGMDEFFGRGVYHCAYCDGWEVRDQPFVIYGSGKQNWGLALQMLTWSGDIVLCSDGPSGLSERDLQILQRMGIELNEQPIARLEGKDGQLERIVFANGEILSRRVIFFQTKMHSRSKLLQKLSPGPVREDTLQPGLPGLYITGDIASSQWISGAVADGAQIGITIHKTLFQEEIARGYTKTSTARSLQ